MIYKVLHPISSHSNRIGLLLILLLTGQLLSAQLNRTSSRSYTGFGGGGASASPTVSHQAFQGASTSMSLHYQMPPTTIYEPFDNTPPSEVGQDTDPGFIPQDRRNLGGAVDPGNQSQGSPVGEPWVMLLFAAATTTIIKIRQVKKT